MIIRNFSVLNYKNNINFGGICIAKQTNTQKENLRLEKSTGLSFTSNPADNFTYVFDDNAIWPSGMTQFFRRDLNWKKFGAYLKEKYPDINNVNIYCLACSTGKEPYSLAVLLDHIYEGSDFKIYASDFDPNRIECCNRRSDDNVLITDTDFYDITHGSAMPYEDSLSYVEHIGTYGYRLRNDLLSRIDFEVKTIQDAIDELSTDKPAIVMCRNVWPYIPSEEHRELANKLYDKLPKGSIIVVGGYDGDDAKTFISALKKNGFHPVNEANSNDEPISLIYEKQNTRDYMQMIIAAAKGD